MKDEIVFVANIAGIRTTVDGGINITLSVSDLDSETVKKLLDNRMKNLHCAIIPEPER